MFKLLNSVLLLSVLQLGCPAEPTDEALPPLPPMDLPEGCNPLTVAEDCLLPFPSDYFLTRDTTYPSGKRVTFGNYAIPYDEGGRDMNPTNWRAMDGFSLLPSILAEFEETVADKGFVHILDDYDLSLSPNSSVSLIIDSETGEAIAHYVDIDSRVEEDVVPMLILHPAETLRPETTYIVALFNLENDEGKLISAPEGFARLKSGRTESDPDLSVQQRFYDEIIFPLLNDHSVAKESLQLAWTFTTGSETRATQDMFRMRSLTMQWLETNAPEIKITSDREVNNDNKRQWRRVEGEIEVPLFLNSAAPGAELIRNEAEDVEQGGIAWVPFTAVIPYSVRDSMAPARLCAFGHGFFGKADTVVGTGSSLAADQLKAILFAIDWWGMSNDDESSVFADITSTPYRVMRFTDRVHQAMMNWIVVRHAFQNGMKEIETFKRSETPGAPGVVEAADGSSNNAGDLLYISDDVYFFGISQGHILGGTLAGVEPVMERYVLHVGGAGFSHMMFRAAPFRLFSEVIETFLTDDPRTQRKIISMVMRFFDRIDPLIYAPYVLQKPLEDGVQTRKVLMQTGIGDDQVPNVASYHHARDLGISITPPTDFSPWGLDILEEMPAQSGMTLYDFGVDTSFYSEPNNPTDDNGVHNGVAAVPEAMSQIDAFLNPDGEIVHTCDGVCDPD